jgi:DNA-binding NarL/FixJ family response regulator
LWSKPPPIDAWSQFPSAAFEAQWAAGQALSVEEMMAQAVAARGELLVPDRANTESSTGAHQPLSRREVDVASLVVRRLNNRQIGEQLVIAEGTANIHVKSILRKLGLTSRVQIATWFVAETGLVEGDGISRPGDGRAVGST